MKNFKMRIFFVAIIMAATISSSLCSAALIFGEGITQNANGDYLITYMSPEEQQLIQVLYVPPNKIKPIIWSSTTIEKDGVIFYRYTILNQKNSPQSLASLGIKPVSSIAITQGQSVDTALFQPITWFGFADHDAGQYRASWIYKNLESINNGLKPGEIQNGFGFNSVDLLGMGVAEFSGNSLDAAFMGEPDEDIVALYDQLVKDTSFVRCNVAVPTIAVPTPFDPAVTLERIQTQTHTWIGMKLLDPIFSSQLDRYLTAAAEAYRHSQPKAAKEDIEKVREMLKKEQPDMGQDEEHESDNNQEKNDDKKSKMIDRLAAKVLDFDLMYVLKRAGEKD